MSTTYDYTIDSCSPAISAEKLELIRRLYKASDTKGAGVEWADCFAEDAKIWAMGEISTGKNEFAKGMNGTWENVDHRVHRLLRAFTVGDDDSEVVIEGVTDSFSPTGERFGCRDWLVKQRYALENGQLKIGHYTIFYVATSDPK